jgi:hypothetical protein
MSKRAHAKSNGGIDHLEGSSRHKRRREAHKSFSDAEIIKSNPSGSDGGPGVVLSKAEVRDIGTKIWQTVKDAVKECVAPLKPLQGFYSLTPVICSVTDSFPSLF